MDGSEDVSKDGKVCRWDEVKMCGCKEERFCGFKKMGESEK